MSNTDTDWKKWGEIDPYYGVLTEDRFRINVIENSFDAFFQTGFEYVADVVETVKKHIDPSFQPRTVLDYGCGVGRLTIPFAPVSAHVVGVDVSVAMITEARKNCARFNVANASFFKADDTLSILQGKKFNLINSYIVFQHIPVQRGLNILENLLELLEERGVGVLHFTYASKLNRRKKFLIWLRTVFPPLYYLVNLKNKRSLSEPPMQMHDYPLREVFKIVQAHGGNEIYLRFTEHGNFFGCMLFFQRSAHRS